MTCPRCGRTMNHHADKSVHGDVDREWEEIYACPGCGASASRRAGASPTEDPDTTKR